MHSFVQNQEVAVVRADMDRPRPYVAINYLCEELNATETTFPATDLKLIYKLGSSQIPPTHEV